MSLQALRRSLHPRPRIPARALLPTALVALLAVSSGGREEVTASLSPELLARLEQAQSCQPSDGPQFACWLEDQEPTRAP